MKFLNHKQALDELKRGNILIVSTDTIPGLACDATNEEAIKSIYKIKHRPPEKTFPLLFPTIEMVKEYLDMNDKEEELATKFWPGGLTLVLKSKGTLSEILESSSGKIGSRIPNNRETSRLIQSLEKPIVATSINLSGEAPITIPALIPAKINAQIAGILEGNYASESNLPSTVVEIINGEIIVRREGVILKDKQMRK
jgi:L-threonylcarbamoyladenylate synthase